VARAPATRPDRWLPTDDPAVRARRHRARVASGTSRLARADKLADLVAEATARGDGSRLVADAKRVAKAAGAAAAAAWECIEADGPGGGETKGACLARLVQSVRLATGGRRGAVGGVGIQRLRRNRKLLRNQQSDHRRRAYNDKLAEELRASLNNGASPSPPGGGPSTLPSSPTAGAVVDGRVSTHGAPVQAPVAVSSAAAPTPAHSWGASPAGALASGVSPLTAVRAWRSGSAHRATLPAVGDHTGGHCVKSPVSTPPDAVEGEANEAAADNNSHWVPLALDALIPPRPPLPPRPLRLPSPTLSPPAGGDGCAASPAAHTTAAAAASPIDEDLRQLQRVWEETAATLTTRVGGDKDNDDCDVGQSHVLPRPDALPAAAPNHSLVSDGWLPPVSPVHSLSPADLDWVAAAYATAGTGGGGRDAGAPTGPAGETSDGGGHPRAGGSTDGTLPAAAAQGDGDGGGGDEISVYRRPPDENPRTPEEHSCASDADGNALTAEAGATTATGGRAGGSTPPEHGRVMVVLDTDKSLLPAG